MTKNYIKMNDNKNYLSLGNIINTIKNISNNKSTAMQSEVFCSIFGLNNINNTTINNYCIGIRAIALEYKKIYIDLNKKYEKDKDVFIDIILSLISILDDKIYVKDDNSLNLINNNENLDKVCKELEIIISNDEHIEKDFIKEETNYEKIIKYLTYAILSNQQPIYVQAINININKQELAEYLKVKLYWGESYINSLIELSRKNNMYACAELGSLEFDGYISGEKNFKKCYEYYYKAAQKNHPKGCWMVANLMLTKRVEYDFETMWNYLQKAIELGSAAAYNTLGLCYLKGINKENEVNIEKAKYYFNLATEQGYVFAFNNLGKILENDGNIEEAIKYYKISADMNEGWALNKVGEYYRKKGDLKTALIYYTKSIETPISERVKYGYYNLAKYYYENGCKDANIEKNEELAKHYYKLANDCIKE